MKKPQLVLLSALLAVAATATTAQAQRVGIRGGVSFANQEQRLGGQNIENDGVTLCHAGLTSDFELSDNFAVRPELLFSRKGQDFSGSYGGLLNVVSNDRLSYLTLPVTLAFKAEVGPGKVVLGAGPYAGLLLGGKRETSVTVLGFGPAGTRDIRIGDAETTANGPGDDYRPLDAGVNFQAGYELTEQMFILANYSLGLTDVRANGDDNNYQRNRSFELGVGFYLNQ